MKVHLNQIPGHGLHLEGEEAASFLDLPESQARSASPLRYRLDVGLSDGGLFATGELAVDVSLECVNCLTRFIYPIRILDFAMQMELPGTEMVDLTPQIREDILLALPPYPHCDWNGENVCKGAVRKEESEAIPEAPGTWDELDKLKFKSKKQ